MRILNVLIYLEKIIIFSPNSSVSAHAYCESNRVHR